MREADYLVSAGCASDVVAHCLKVSETALSIAKQVKTVSIDADLVRVGGLLHDIGRSMTHGIDHAIAGVEIGRGFGFPEVLLSVIERHIGAGITASEAARLGLPAKDYLPQTPEEKIVSYADNLISGVREMLFSEALERFARILGPDHEGVELFRKQHEEMRKWMK